MPASHRIIEVYGTGNMMIEPIARGVLSYIGTVQMTALVWHVFERVL
jgi:hypothetical protein